MSFRLKTIIGVATIEAVLLLLLIWTGISYLRSTSEAELIKRASSTLTLLARASHDAVLSTDLSTLEAIVSEAVKTPELAYVRILDSRGTVLAESRNVPPSTGVFRADRSYEDVDDGIFDSAIDITVSRSRYGRIEIGLSTAHINSSIRSARQNATAIALLEMALVALFSLALGTYLTRQLSSLMTATDRIAAGDYGYQVAIRGQDELARTAAAFNRMSAELKLDREKQAAIHRSALDAIITLDRQGRIIEFNPAAEATFGYRRDDIIGRRVQDTLIPPAMRRAYENEMTRYLETGQSMVLDRRIRVTALRADGEEFPLELAASAVDIDGSKLFTAFMRDISSQLRREQDLHEAKEAAEAASRAKTRFLAGMSHEMRTPLNALLGFLGLLGEQKNITGEQHGWIRTAQQSGTSLLHLINDTLDFSRIEAGKMALEPHDFDLRELVSSTMDVLAPKAAARGLEFSASVAAGVPGRIREDSARLRQVLINLLDNAIKFTDTGTIELVVETCGLDSRPCLRFSVCDTGPGIAASEHDAVFGEFTRLAETGTLAAGTGLGLSITRRLVELMGGRIDFENRASGGTRFWFEIPLTAAAEPAPASPPAAMDDTVTLQPGSRILLADDSPANQMVALAMLQDSGCTVDTASNGLEAVEAVRALPYDLVLMDISMPEMDGLAATAAIRTLAGSKGRIPVIAMTAHAIAGDRETFLAAGMNDYLSKPVTRQRLYEILTRWLPTGQADRRGRADMALSGQSASPVLDTAVFRQLARDTSEAIVPKMLAAFCTETRGRIDHLKQAGDSHSIDLAILQREAHTLKSSAATFGATALHRIARDVESACRESREADARHMLAALIGHAEEAIRAVTAYLDGQASHTEEPANP